MELKEVNGAEFLPLANARNRLLQQNVSNKFSHVLNPELI
jgi:hypothetical protein